MLFLPTMLVGCLIERDFYEQRRAELTDADGDGAIARDDCDDTAPDVFPGATERCDGVDQDCDGEVDDDADDALTWYVDADEDGYGSTAGTTTACEAPAAHAATDDDCDDDDASVYPDAADTWYDGIDQNCDGADDYDADQDGDRTDEAGGTDCDDEDATVSGTTAEGWLDAGTDNNCDGSVLDPVVVDLDAVGVAVDGAAENDAFGSSVAAVPAGWLAEEAVVLIAAPFAGGVGAVYGWTTSQLADAPRVTTAAWTLEGEAPDDLLGFGIGWGGDADSPLVFVSAEGAEGGQGSVYVWLGSEWGGEPSVTLLGGAAGTYFGARVLSGHDHDGDGVDDLVVTAPTDARVAANAGAAFVFLGVTAAIDGATAYDADLELSTPYAGALLSVSSVGDVDGDGVDDLGISHQIADSEGPGGLLVAGGLAAGAYDAVALSMAHLYGGPMVFGQAVDPDGDGRQELLAASGSVYRFDLPLSGTITPWDDAEGELPFADSGHFVGWLRSDLAEAAGHTAFAAASWNYDGSRGMLAVEWSRWGEEEQMEDAPFLALGTQAGDLAGLSLDLMDFDGDERTDFVVGAPAADPGGAGSGTVYLVPGPR